MIWVSKLINNIVFQTVISGVLVFLASEIVQKFIFDPLKEYKSIIGKIDNRLKYYSHIITNSGFETETIREVSRLVRNLSCELESAYKQLPFKIVFEKLSIIGSRNQIYNAARSLILVSNITGATGNEQKNEKEILKIRELLNIAELSDQSK